ncbi:RDD family protein [Chitinilyticum piscinae]|uniref:RDD family protein n=1 Tax=Chitinilyticum piscinae TaxID=2866724 RepID=A0A8J7FHQ3_9NEIS|nr:RDD family protein [Chitinilyticum piscinae]MBE9608415.1 RDD family protein [Chitinilyticum piscinae]
MTTNTTANAALPAASWGKRLLALIYDTLLTSALVMVLGFAFHLNYKLFTGMDAAAIGKSAVALQLQFIWVSAFTAAYFVFCWSRSGQTLALRTWRCRIVGRNDGTASILQCLLRFGLASLFYLPPLPLWFMARHDASLQPLAWLACGLAALPWIWAWVRRDRQLLHDTLAGTRIVQLPQKQKQPA